MNLSKSCARALLVFVFAWMNLGLVVAPSPEAPEWSTADESPVGFEIMLRTGNAAIRAPRGSSTNLEGVAYEVERGSTMQAVAGLILDCELQQASEDGRTQETVRRWSFRSEHGGQFRTQVLIPEQTPRALSLRVHIHRTQLAGRVLRYPVDASEAYRIDGLLDRNRYEAGETVHMWALVRRNPLLRVVGDTPVAFVVDGPLTVRRELRTGSSGAATFDYVLPADAPTGAYRVLFQAGDAAAGRTFMVGNRSTDRVLPRLVLSRTTVRVGELVRGIAVARTPTGVPIVGATVRVGLAGEVSATVQTNEAGEAAFAIASPAYIEGASESFAVTAQIDHASVGNALLSANVEVTRKRYDLAVYTPNASLVPGVENEILVHLSAIEEAAANAQQVTLRIPGVSGQWTAQADADGVARFAVALPEGVGTENAGECEGRALAMEVSVRDRVTSLFHPCLPVNERTSVVPHARELVLHSGDTMHVRLARRDEYRGWPVSVELLDGEGALLISEITTANEVALPLPSEAIGRVQIRARVLGQPSDVRAPTTEGGLSVLPGGRQDVFVLPGDGFELSLSPSSSTYRVRDTAVVNARFSRGVGHLVMVARDLAQHGGETPFLLENPWFAQLFASAALRPREQLEAHFLGRETHVGLVAVRLAELVEESEYFRGATPQSSAPWAQNDEDSNTGGPLLRDPMSEREVFLREQFARIIQEIEAAVDAQLEERDAFSVRTGRGTQFRIDALETLGIEELAFGGKLLRIADLSAIDPTFSFDNIARRHTRAQLPHILFALSQISDPEHMQWARRLHGVPPSRWLSIAVDLGLLAPEDIHDAWGRPFAFRDAGRRRPTLIVSERAANFELVSSGPDGAFGNADDVRDPFARILASGSRYAIAVGEDELIEQLSSLAPAERSLERMMQAFASFGVEAEDERQPSLVTASASAEYADANAESPMLAGGLGMRGNGSGGGGSGSGSIGLGSFGAVGHGSGMGSASMMAREGSGNMAAAASDIRSEFPATLFFAGEVEVSSSGAAISIPLLDALTTYRVEAFGWTASGFTAHAQTEIRVDRILRIDPTLPSFARVGDKVRIPVFLHNLSDEAVVADVQTSVDGDLRLSLQASQRVNLPAHGVAHVVFEATCSARSSGHVVFAVVGAGQRDAVRLPFEVRENARSVRTERTLPLRAGTDIAIDFPETALAEGRSVSLSFVDGRAMFAPLTIQQGNQEPQTRYLETSGDEEAAFFWLENGRILPPALVERLATKLRDIPVRGYPGDAFHEALALASLLPNDALTDEVRRAVMQHLLATITTSCATSCDIGFAIPLARIQAQSEIGAPQLAAVAMDVKLFLDGVVEAITARAPFAQREEAVLLFAALTSLSRAPEIAAELRVRIERDVLVAGARKWLEYGGNGQLVESVLPTAAFGYSLALVDRGLALPYLEHLLRIRESTSGWDSRALMFARALLLHLAASADVAQILWDGVAQEPSATAAAIEITDIVAHRLSVRGGTGFGVLHVEQRYLAGYPTRSRSEGLLAEIALEGSPGALGNRSAYWLRVRNTSGATLVHPRVEISLPPGAIWDEESRTELSRHLATPVLFQDGLAILSLRRLSVGDSIELPLRLRNTVAGEFQSYGAALYDNAHQELAFVRAPDRILITDEGREPDMPARVVANAAQHPLPVVPIVPIAPFLEATIAGGAR